MSNRISRRERRRRLYFLLAIMARAAAAFPRQPFDWPGMFATEPETFQRWRDGREDIPTWIPQLGRRAYGIPEPPAESFTWRLVVGILLAIVAGAAAVVVLARLAR